MVFFRVIITIINNILLVSFKKLILFINSFKIGNAKLKFSDVILANKVKISPMPTPSFVDIRRSNSSKSTIKINPMRVIKTHPKQIRKFLQT